MTAEELQQPTLENATWPSINALKFSCPRCGQGCSSAEQKTTLVGYSSPIGHNHDGNCRTFLLRCDQGHAFTVRPINTCPVADCDWRGKAECRVCGPWYKEIE